MVFLDLYHVYLFVYSEAIQPKYKLHESEVLICFMYSQLQAGCQTYGRCTINMYWMNGCIEVEMLNSNMGLFNLGFRRINITCEKIPQLIISSYFLNCVAWDTSPHLFLSVEWDCGGILWKWIRNLCPTAETYRKNKSSMTYTRHYKPITERHRTSSQR